MVKQTIKVDGMMCSMCEAHVNDAVRNNFNVKSVKADRSKGVAEIVAEEALDADKLKSVIEATGYTCGEISCEPYKKKGLFSRS